VPVSSRDVYQLEHELASDILVRQGLIFVNLESLRAFIFADRCLILPPEGSDEVLAPIFDRFGAAFDVRNGVSV
jgi:hypothetical protein